MRLKRIHPRTGEELVPLFVTKRGALVWPQMGASPEDPIAGDGGEEDDDEGDDTGTGGSGDDTDDDDGKADKAVTREDLEAVIRRMKAADQRASKAEAALKKIEDGKKDELTRATERAEAAEAKVKELEKRILEADVRDAFQQADIQWKKPATALRIARADGYLDDVLQDDGTVDTKILNKKVKEFAEAFPELVAPKKEDTGDGGTPVAPATGQPAGSGRKKPGAPDDKLIKDRYSHLIR